MSHFARTPWAGYGWGFLLSIAVGIAVFGFGAPGWILVPVSWAGITVFFSALGYLDRHADRSSHR